MTGIRNHDKVKAALEKVWLHSRPEAFSRLATLEGFAEELRSGTAHPEHLAAAELAAHRLSGSLGMFGLDDASSCAAEIEAVLCHQSAPDITVMAGLVRRLRNLMEGTPPTAKIPHKHDL